MQCLGKNPRLPVGHHRGFCRAYKLQETPMARGQSNGEKRGGDLAGRDYCRTGRGHEILPPGTSSSNNAGGEGRPCRAERADRQSASHGLSRMASPLALFSSPKMMKYIL
jgi:hypothetical protein